MSVANDIKDIFEKIAADFRALVNRINLLERSLNYLTPKVSVERADPDSEGIYRSITHKRANGTTIQVSRLEHDINLDVIGGVYNKRVTVIYNITGSDVVDITAHHLKYDTSGCIVSETLIP